MSLHVVGVTVPHGQHGLRQLFPAGRVIARAGPTKASAGHSAPPSCTSCRHVACSNYGNAFSSSSERRRLRRSDLAVCRYRGEGSEGGAAVEQQQKQTASKEVLEQAPEEDEGLLTHVPVVFELGKHCTFGHSFAVVGETPELGNWDTHKAAKMEWSAGDLWLVSVSLPVDTPVSFKYIELGEGDQLVAWGTELPDGNNMTVTVTRTDELISGYKVDMVHGASHPHMSVRLDVTALLPMSAAFFKEKHLAVSAGLPAAVAEDLMTDRVLVEQGLMNEAELEAKWSMAEMSAIRDQYADAAVGESWDANPAATPQDQLIAATESDVIIAAPEAGGQDVTGPAAALAATAAALAAAAVGELPADDDIIAATESDVIQLADDTADAQPAAVPLAAAVAAVNDAEAGDDIIDALDDVPEDDEDDDVDDDIIGANDDVTPSAAAADVSTSPATPSATAAATRPMHNTTATVLTSLSTAEQFSPTGSSSSSSDLKCPPPVNTKFVSAGPSVDSVDLHSPLADVNKAIVEFDAKGVEPVEPIHVDQGLEIPGIASSSSSSSAAEGAQQQEPAKVPKVKLTTDGSSFGVSMRGDDPLSLPGPPEVAAVRGAAAAAGFDTDAKSLGDHGLLVPREILEDQQTDHAPGSSISSSDLDALAAAVAAAAAASVRYAGQTAAANELERPQAGASDSPAAAAALTAASVRYAGQAAAAAVEESAADASTAAKAVDERSALLHGPGSDESVSQIMSEGGVISSPADSDTEVQGVQEVSNVVREAEHEKMKQQRSHKKPGGLWKWILGKKDY